MPLSSEPPLPPAERWPLATVLVVDDEPGMCNFLVKTLATRVGQVFSAESAEAADVLMRHHRFDLVVLDIALPGISGIDWLKQLRERGFAGEVVLITAFADLDTAIEALRAGASDFLLKPFRVTQILNAVRQGLERALLRRENWVLRRALSQRMPDGDGLVGPSIAIKGLQAALQRVAAVDSTVLLSGESGTGKELAALALHRNSPRAARPFVPVNCATMSPDLIDSELFGQAQAPQAGMRSGAGTNTPVSPRKGRDGLFVYAQGGTLFLDEVGELPLPQQATLLRVLEERRIRPVGSEQEIPVDVRIVAATNRDLREMASAGRFREDLYFRLSGFSIHVPPLRERREDIPALLRFLLAHGAERFGVVGRLVIDPDAEEILNAYDWPGNVRELENVLQRATILAEHGRITVADLPPQITPVLPLLGASATAPQGSGPLRDHVREFEHALILRAIEDNGGDRRTAAQRLGIGLSSLYRKLEEYELARGPDAPGAA